MFLNRKEEKFLIITLIVANIMTLFPFVGLNIRYIFIAIETVCVLMLLGNFGERR